MDHQKHRANEGELAQGATQPSFSPSLAQGLIRHSGLGTMSTRRVGRAAPPEGRAEEPGHGCAGWFFCPFSATDEHQHGQKYSNSHRVLGLPQSFNDPKMGPHTTTVFPLTNLHNAYTTSAAADAYF